LRLAALPAAAALGRWNDQKILKKIRKKSLQKTFLTLY